MQVIINEALQTTAYLNSTVNNVSTVGASLEIAIGTPGFDVGEMPETSVPSAKGSVLSSWTFVGGITAATLVVSVILGILLAKKRIKKGFDLYED